jgi:hypothetical protein
VVYDAFDQPQFDGRFDEEKWLEARPPGEVYCQFIQQEGVMQITDVATQGQSVCDLHLTHPALLKGNELVGFSAKLFLSDGHKGVAAVHLTTGISFPTGDWVVQCGIVVDDQISKVVFLISDNRPRTGTENPIRFVSEKNIEANQWYAFQLRVDNETMAFSCWVDGEELGSYQPDNQAELRENQFEHSFGSWRLDGASVTFFLDEFQTFSVPGTR